MGLMDREKHEELLNELLSEDLTIDRKTEILQTLRTDHVATHESYSELESTNSNLTKDKEELLLSNSKMFRQLGVTGNSEAEEEEKKKEFSETVTIKELEDNSGVY